MAKRGKRVRLQKINRQSGNNQYYVTVPQTLLEQTSLGEDAEFTWELNESNGLSLRSEVCSDESEMSCGICLLDEFWRCWELIRPAFNTEEQWANAGLIAIGDILNTERHTLSQALAGTGLGEQDWNQFYRLFSKRRLDIEAFERALLQQLVQELPADAPVVLLIDDTQLRKSGKKIPGAKWLRDSLGPKFNVNLIWGQRFLQVSLAIPSSGGGCRSYPITFLHCPMPEKPGRQASAAQQEEYKVRLSDMALPRVAAEKVQELVAQLPGRRVEIVGDGGYTNSTFVRNLPEKNCVYLPNFPGKRVLPGRATQEKCSK